MEIAAGLVAHFYGLLVTFLTLPTMTQTEVAEKFRIPDPPPKPEESERIQEARTRTLEIETFKKRLAHSEEGRALMTGVFDECVRESMMYVTAPTCIGGTSLFYWALTRGYISHIVPPMPIIVVRCAFIAVSGLVISQSLYSMSGASARKFERAIETNPAFDKFKSGLSSFTLAPSTEQELPAR